MQLLEIILTNKSIELSDLNRSTSRNFKLKSSFWSAVWKLVDINDILIASISQYEKAWGIWGERKFVIKGDVLNMEFQYKQIFKTWRHELYDVLNNVNIITQGGDYYLIQNNEGEEIGKLTKQNISGLFTSKIRFLIKIYSDEEVNNSLQLLIYCVCLVILKMKDNGN